MIILNYNDSRRALQLAEKCRRYSAIDKVVIVDNKSTDDSLQYLNNRKAKEIDLCVANENRGFSAGNNIGAKYVVKTYKPQMILFANTDTIFGNEDILACQTEIGANDRLGLVSLRMKDVQENEERAAWKYKSVLQYILSNFWIYRHNTYKNDRYHYDNKSVIQFVDMVRGSFMMFRTKALVEAGYFDEGTFLYYEEECISYRLKKRGYIVGVITNHFYIHNHVYSGENNECRIKRTMANSLSYFLVQYYEIGALYKIALKIALKYSYIEYLMIEKVKKKIIKAGDRKG